MKKLLSLNLVVLFITAVLIIFSTSCSQKIEQASIKNTTSTKDVPVSFDSVNLMRIYRDLATMQINLLNDIVNSSIDTTTFRRLESEGKRDSLYFLLGTDSTTIAKVLRVAHRDADSILIILSQVKDTSLCHCGNWNERRKLTTLLKIVQFFRENQTDLGFFTSNILPNTAGGGSGCWNWWGYASCDAACVLYCTDPVTLILCHTWCWCVYCVNNTYSVCQHTGSPW